jgi:hypothetical protein
MLIYINNRLKICGVKQTYFTGTDITGWFEEIYDLDGVVGYVTKYDGKKDVLTGNDKMILLGV